MGLNIDSLSIQDITTWLGMSGKIYSNMHYKHHFLCLLWCDKVVRVVKSMGIEIRMGGLEIKLPLTFLRLKLFSLIFLDLGERGPCFRKLSSSSGHTFHHKRKSSCHQGVCVYLAPASPLLKQAFGFLGPIVQMTLYPLSGPAQASLLVCFPWVDHKNKVSSRESYLVELGLSWDTGAGLSTDWTYEVSWRVECGLGWEVGIQNDLSPYLCVPVWSLRN